MTRGPDRGLQLWFQRLALRSRVTAADAAAVLALPGTLELIRANVDFVGLRQDVASACLVVDGLTARFGQTREGARQLSAIHLPGDMADLHSVVVPRASSALSALTDTLIYRIPHRAILAAGETSPTLKDAMWRDCVADTSIAWEWLLNNGRRDALARVAHLLCEMSVRSGDIGEDPARYPLRMSQAQLADAASLTSVHVNRMLRRLRDADVVSIDHRVVTVHDPAQLKRLAEFDDAYLHRHADQASGGFRVREPTD